LIDWLLQEGTGRALELAAEIGSDLEGYFGQPFAGEIQGLANAFNISEGIIALMNCAYELTDAWYSSLFVFILFLLIFLVCFYLLLFGFPYLFF
jgi:hypothetical protein